MNLPRSAKARLAIDVGGTFTDVVIGRSGRLWTTKVLTTPDAPERGVTSGIKEVLNDSSLRPGAVGISSET